MQEYLTIARVAERSGLSVPTIRYYEQEGLIPRIPRDAAGNRLFGSHEISRVDSIRCLRSAGLTLTEMKRYFGLVEQGNSTLKQRKHLMQDAQNRLRQQMEELQRCLLYLSRKISYYDDASQALEQGNPLPEYQFGQMKSIFDTTCPEP